MAVTETKAHQNPFRRKKPIDFNPFLVSLLQVIPGIDEEKATSLLTNFANFKGLCIATKSDLALVVGDQLAENVHSFLSKNQKITK